MEFASDPSEVVRRVVRSLDAASVPDMLTGSIASAFYGTPRATQDIDLVVSPDRSSMSRLLDQFPEGEYYASREAAMEAFDRRELFNIVDMATSWKIGLILRKDRPFSLAGFDRRRILDLLGTRLYMATAEDVVISKLEWAKLGESERQIRDAAGIIRTQGEALDRSYIETWVHALELNSQWTLANRVAG